MMSTMHPQETGRTPVRVGDAAKDFTLPDPMAGAAVNLSVYRAERDMLLVFFRGTWCPFCREQMRVLRDNYDRLSAANVAVLGIVCQSQESVRHYLEAAPLPFPLLTDETRDVARDFGVHYRFSLEGVNLAHPSIFVLNGEGIVTFVHVGRNMRDLPVTTVIERFVNFLQAAPPLGTS